MERAGKIIVVGTKRYLITDETDWLEGRAFDLVKEEPIYYNGDYNEKRPENIKKLVAENTEIGWVRHPENDVLFRFDSVASIVMPMLYVANGRCVIEEEKKENKFVIKLLS